MPKRLMLNTPLVKAALALLAERALEAQAGVLEASARGSHPALLDAAETLNEIAGSLTRLSSGRGHEVLRDYFNDARL